MAWDHRYRPLAEGEVICVNDEVMTDAHLGWQPAVHTVGQLAPDPAYSAHRMYRRLRETPAEAFSAWLNEGPKLAAAAGCYVGIKVTALKDQPHD